MARQDVAKLTAHAQRPELRQVPWPEQRHSGSRCLGRTSVDRARENGKNMAANMEVKNLLAAAILATPKAAGEDFESAVALPG